jgi:uncharacterized protein (TIGR00251 family)
MDALLIKLKVRAGSRKPAVLKKASDSYEIHVRAPAERGQANAEALAVLAQALGVEPKRLRIIKGAREPAKIVRIY